MRRSFFRTGLLALMIFLGCFARPGLAAPPDTGTRLQKTELEHFTVWSQRELKDVDLYLMRQNLQSVRREVGRAFGGFFPDRKFDVVLTQEDVFRTYSRSPKHVTGLFDGTIHLPVKMEGRPKRLKAILYHEYTHALLWLASEGHCPSWIHEAFAVDQEERVDSQRTLDVGQIVVGERLRWPLTDLDARLKPNAENPMINEWAYEEAYGVARYLRSCHKPVKILKWMRELGRSGDWQDALKKVFRMDAEELERETAGFLKG